MIYLKNNYFIFFIHFRAEIASHKKKKMMKEKKMYQ